MKMFFTMPKVLTDQYIINFLGLDIPDSVKACKNVTSALRLDLPGSIEERIKSCTIAASRVLPVGLRND